MVAQDDITSLSREAPLVHTSIKPFSQIALVHIQIGRIKCFLNEFRVMKIYITNLKMLIFIKEHNIFGKKKQPITGISSVLY